MDLGKPEVQSALIFPQFGHQVLVVSHRKKFIWYPFMILCNKQWIPIGNWWNSTHRQQGKLILIEPVLSQILNAHCLIEWTKRFQNSYQGSHVSSSPYLGCAYLKTEITLTSFFFISQFLYAAPNKTQLKD